MQDTACGRAHRKDAGDGLKKDRQDEIAALTELLDSEDAVEVIMAKFLQITVGALKLSGGFVCHMDRKERTADILAQWYGRGNVSPFEKQGEFRRRIFCLRRSL